MVSDTVLGAAIGVSGAVIGSLLTGAFSWLNTQQQVQAANQRRRAEFVAERKVDELMEMSHELRGTHDIVLESLSRLEGEKKIDTDRLVERPIQLRDQIHATQMFLDDDKVGVLYEFYHDVITAEAYILRESGNDLERTEDHIISETESERPDLNERASEFDLEQFEEQYREATNMLRWEVAEPIERLR